MRGEIETSDEARDIQFCYHWCERVSASAEESRRPPLAPMAQNAWHRHELLILEAGKHIQCQDRSDPLPDM